jgi:predicted nucleic acid-binding protein
MTTAAGSAGGPVVVDASVALKWVLDEPGSAAAAALLDGRALHAPDLLAIEAGNALWAAARRGLIGAGAAAEALDLILRAPFRPPPRPLPLAARALALAQLIDHPVHGCTYLALGLALAAPVVTADRRFAAAAARHPEAAPFVRLLEGVG